MRVKEALKEATLRLKNIDNPQKEARLLLSHFLKQDMIYLVLNEDKEVSCEFFNLVQKRAENIPLEYITKKVSFYSEEFFIDYGALIPRPESELLIDEVLKLPLKKGFKLAEIGVGSGILSIMIAKLTGSKVLASDISQDALKIAEINIKKFNLKEQITLKHTSLLDNVEETFDIIISNPPYIEDGIKLESNLDYEPQNALFGGKVGDEILKDIVDLSLVKKPQYLVCEMGYDQKQSMSNYFDKKGLTQYSFYKDLAGLDRGFVVKF